MKKMIYLFKRIKLQNQYNDDLKQANQALEDIKVIENNYDFANRNIQIYYIYELKLLKAKYNHIINQLKIIDKNLESI